MLRIPSTVRLLEWGCLVVVGGLVLYPLSAFRAMSRAASEVYETIRARGTQSELIGAMQTREQLYDVIGYHDAERALDALFSAQKKPRG